MCALLSRTSDSTATTESFAMNISQRIDRLPMTPFMRKVIVIAGIGLMFDAMDQGMVSGVIASIGREWVLTSSQLGFLASAGVVGMFVGALLAGFLSDRFGRRSIVLVTLLIFSAGSALCGLSTNYEMLLVFRFITGLGLGGELPVVTTMVSEFSPLRSRGRNVVLIESFWAWGWIIASLVAYLAIPAYGWRIAFFIGAVPALFAALLRFMLPESPRYLDSVGKRDEADKIVTAMEKQAGAIDSAEGAETANIDTAATTVTASTKTSEAPTQMGPARAFATLFSKHYRRATIMIWILWFGVNLGYYGFVLWTPSLLVAQGYDLVKSFGFTLIMCIAQLPGYFTAAYLIEKIGRKPVLVIFLLGTAASAWMFGQAGSTTMILIAGCLLYFFSLGTWGCIYSYTPEQYPTHIRGAGGGYASAFGRIGAFIAPMIVPLLYGSSGSQQGFQTVFLVLTGVFVIVAVAVCALGKETKGVNLD